MRETAAVLLMTWILRAVGTEALRDPPLSSAFTGRERRLKRSSVKIHSLKIRGTRLLTNNCVAAECRVNTKKRPKIQTCAKIQNTRGNKKILLTQRELSSEFEVLLVFFSRTKRKSQKACKARKL